MGLRRVLVVLLAFAAFTVPLRAEWVRGGLYGADIRALVVDPADPDRIFVGTSQGEVYVSTDGARSWTNPRGANPFPDYVVDNLVIDSKGSLWAACWGLWGGGAIAFSSDGGKTWTRRDAGLEEESIRAFVSDPGDASHLVVGSLTGAFQSRDSGLTWQRISDLANVESLAIDPRDGNRLYVGTWRQAFRTEDGGRSWKLINNGMVLDTDVFTITIDEKNPDNVWASTCGWVYSSSNRGSRWTRYRDGFDNRRIHDVKIGPVNRSRVLAGSVAGLYATEDNGKTWKRISDDTLVVNAIGVTPERPDRIVLGTEGDGIYVSNDGGASFARSSNGLYNVRSTALVGDPEVANRLWAAVVFGNAASGVYRSNDSGATWQKVSETRLPEVLTLVAQKAPNARLVAGTEKGFFWSDDGVTWTVADPLVPLRVEKIVRHSDARMFAATNDGVFTSRDGGRGWYRLKDSTSKTIDITLASLGDAPAVYALMADRLSIFDGAEWTAIDGIPGRAHSVVVRHESDLDAVIFSTPKGLLAGTIRGKLWVPLADDSAVATRVRQASDLDRAILAVHESAIAPFSNLRAWRSLRLPVAERSISSITTDPFDPTRLLVATNGQGVFVWRSQTN